MLAWTATPGWDLPRFVPELHEVAGRSCYSGIPVLNVNVKGELSTHV